MNLLTDIIGYMAAVVGTFLMLPQVIRALRTKHMKDVSFFMLLAYVVNCLLWDMYGMLLHSLPMTLCNSIGLIIGLWQIVLKKTYTS